MRLKGYHLWLLAIFLLVLGLRILITTQSSLLSDDNSYFTLRQVESIKDSGKPVFYDELSYGGRTLLISPFFFYLLALVYFISAKIITLKIFMNILASTLVFASFLIADELTKSKKIALLTAFLSGFIPVYFQETVNSLSIYSLTLPLTFFSIYYLIMLNKDNKYYTHFLMLLFILIITSPTSIIFVLGILFFLILAKLEKIEVNKSNVEILIVSMFFYLWLNFLLFKKAILFHGPGIIWQNIPKVYLYQYFSELSILQEVYLIGILPFVLGIYTAYVYVTRQKSFPVYIIIGASSSLFFLLWFKLIPFKTGLVFLGGFLVLLISSYFKLLFDYISQTKFAKFENLALTGFIIIIIVSSLIPSVVLGINKVDKTPSQASLNAYSWIKDNNLTKETILASGKEGHALAYYANSKTVMDDNFLLVKDVNQRIVDVKRIYTTRFSEEALDLSSKYNIKYIMVNEAVKGEYNITDLYYVSDECFNQVYNQDKILVYKITCGEEI